MDGVVRADPDDFDALWRGARESVSLGMLASETDSSKAWYLRAEGYARRARTLEPARSQGGEWLAIALGRLALTQGIRTRVRTALEVRQVAEETLVVDPSSAGAHHVLGEWHAEVKRLSRVERWLARKLMGADAFKDASWDEAVAHLRRAVELDPGGLVHHFDLARVYLDIGQRDQARRELQEVITLPVAAPGDDAYKVQAERLLGQL